MGINALLKKAKGRVVGIDTMNFIYAFEENPQYLHIIKPLMEKIESGYIRAVTSTITVTECLVKPYKTGDISLVAKYKMLFKNFPNLQICPPTFEIAEKAAELKAAYKIRTPDAIQLSTCFVNDASIFVTNDLSLSGVKGITLVQLDEMK